MNAPDRTRRGAESSAAPLERDLVATLAVTAYSFAIAIGFARVFSGWDFLGDLGTIVIAGHGMSFVLRRARVSGWLAIPATTVFVLWVVALVQYRSTLSGGIIPWHATWDQISLDVNVVRDQFQTAVAPVIYDVGWATLASLAMVLVVVMADSFAFRAEARGEALVPGGVLFVFIAALSSPRLRVGATVLLVAAGVLAVIALRSLHDRTRRVELATGRRTSWSLPGAVASAVFVAVLAGYVGPRVPGADAEPLYETRGRGGGVTNVINPLVDIRSRLVNRGNVELFRVNATAEAYWRVAALPEFNGRTFTLPTSPLGRVDDAAGGGADGSRVIRQQVQILSLGGKLLPAAADAERVSPNADVRLDPQSDSLVKTSELEPEEVYTIESEAPSVTPDTLRAAGTANPPDEVFLDLPDLPDVIGDTAALITEGAQSDYDRMIALQDWFQTFRYTTEVQAGHAVQDIETFLQVQAGYCEQFSVTFAAMARSLGVPSRVAVGFTPGTLRSDGWYAVLGKNAHAWPEIWFDGIGWIPFEPTPSRGIPGAEGYTGLVPAQDTSPPEQVGEPGEGQAIPPSPTTVFRPPSSVPSQRPQFQDPDANPQQPTRPGTATAADGGGFPWVVLVLFVLLVIGLVAPAVTRWWRWRAARRHGTAERVAAAWQRACRAVTSAGVDAQPSMTSRQWAEATAEQIPVAARPMSSLADMVDRVEFSRPGSIDLADTASTLGDECELWASQVGRIAVDTLPTTKRATRYFTDWG